jgi:hypothetical protein
LPAIGWPAASRPSAGAADFRAAACGLGDGSARPIGEAAVSPILSIGDQPVLRIPGQRVARAAAHVAISVIAKGLTGSALNADTAGRMARSARQDDAALGWIAVGFFDPAPRPAQQVMRRIIGEGLVPGRINRSARALELIEVVIRVDPGPRAIAAFLRDAAQRIPVVPAVDPWRDTTASIMMRDTAQPEPLVMIAHAAADAIGIADQRRMAQAVVGDGMDRPGERDVEQLCN